MVGVTITRAVERMTAIGSVFGKLDLPIRGKRHNAVPQTIGAFSRIRYEEDIYTGRKQPTGRRRFRRGRKYRFADRCYLFFDGCVFREVIVCFCAISRLMPIPPQTTQR